MKHASACLSSASPRKRVRCDEAAARRGLQEQVALGITTQAECLDAVVAWLRANMATDPVRTVGALDEIERLRKLDPSARGSRR